MGCISPISPELQVHITTCFVPDYKMVVQVISPSSQAIPATVGLVEMMNAIEAYVTPRHGNSPENAANAYLALALAFEQAGIACVPDFPVLSITFASNGYKVSKLEEPLAKVS